MNPIASHLLWQIINRSSAPAATPATGIATSFNIDDIINPRAPRRVEDVAPTRPLAKAA